MLIIYFVVSDIMYTFVSMNDTTNYKLLQKIIKREGTIEINEDGGMTKGTLIIKRIKLVKQSYHDRVRPEVDIEYRGTINSWGTTMGPVASIEPQITRFGSPYRKHWVSKVQRNRKVRRLFHTPIQYYLKYFGVDTTYSFELTIKKITWNEI